EVGVGVVRLPGSLQAVEQYLGVALGGGGEGSEGEDGGRGQHKARGPRPARPGMEDGRRQGHAQERTGGTQVDHTRRAATKRLGRAVQEPRRPLSAPSYNPGRACPSSTAAVSRPPSSSSTSSACARAGTPTSTSSTSRAPWPSWPPAATASAAPPPT